MLFLLDNHNCTNTAINLALEEYTVRNLDLKDDYLLLSINHPSVVVGKHQNVFEEVNGDILRENLIPVYRRISGGGAVFHDLGNINYSFITQYNKSYFNYYREFTLPVIKVLKKLGLPVNLNKQNDIVYQNHKISGTAQFTSRNRMVTHGTLLFNSNLNLLKKCLSVSQVNIVSKSRKSNKSPVANIYDLLSTKISIEELKDLLIREYFQSQPKILYFQHRESAWKEIKVLAQGKYENWDWNFGESPNFRINISQDFPAGFRQISISVEKGRIAKVNVAGENLSEDSLILFYNKLIKIPYVYKIFLEKLKEKDLFPIFGDISVESFLEMIY